MAAEHGVEDQDARRDTTSWFRRRKPATRPVERPDMVGYHLDLAQDYLNKTAAEGRSKPQRDRDLAMAVHHMLQAVKEGRK